MCVCGWVGMCMCMCMCKHTSTLTVLCFLPNMCALPLCYHLPTSPLLYSPLLTLPYPILPYPTSSYSTLPFVQVMTISALEQGKNVLVDGSLRDASWYLSYIRYKHTHSQTHTRIRMFFLLDLPYYPI